MPSTSTAAIAPDADLYAAASNGDLAAFRAIVERYQNLVCSIAYSALGDVGRSEDLAQETFVIAWRSLRDLKEPAKLKAWLCGIARRLTANYRRRAATDVAIQAEGLGDRNPVAPDMAAPLDVAIRHEEELVLWEVLSNLPPQFREPLVLYHRGQQSVAEVAAQLELSEDAVKQRLARGRKLLKAEVAAFVEKSLRDSRPGTAFAAAVLAALPAAAPPTMAAGLTAVAESVGGKAAAGAGAGLTAALLGPILGVIGASFGVVGGIIFARSRRERRFVVQLVFMVLALVAMLLAIQWIGYRFLPDKYGTFTFQSVLWGGYAIVLVGLILWAKRRARQVQLEEGTASAPIAGSETLGELRDLPLAAVMWHLAALMYVVVACCVVLPAVSAGDWVTPGVATILTSLVWMAIKRRLAVADTLERRIAAYLVANFSSGAIAIAACSIRWSAWKAAEGAGGFARSFPLWAMNSLILMMCGGCTMHLLIWYRKASRRRDEFGTDEARP